MMKLSDAMMLGSTQMQLDGGHWYFPEKNCGCLIGMGLFAINKHYEVLKGIGSERSAKVVEIWPWLGEMLEIPSCAKKNFLFQSYATIETKAPAFRIISAMAYEVQSGRMTFEQALEWVKQHEPKEEVVNGDSVEERVTNRTTSTGNDVATTVECDNQTVLVSDSEG